MRGRIFIVLAMVFENEINIYKLFYILSFFHALFILLKDQNFCGKKIKSYFFSVY